MNIRSCHTKENLLINNQRENTFLPGCKKAINDSLPFTFTLDVYFKSRYLIVISLYYATK